MADRRAYRCLPACLFLSGMSGLVYEVAWVRSLELIFGATTFAVATVLASFMGGLAAGSAAAGAWETRLRRWHPLRLYAACEAGIALAALLIRLAFRLLVPMSRGVWGVFQASFTAFSLLRFLMCAAVLLVPTALMGATLPILSRFVAETGAGSEPARRIGFLFVVNTTGAVAGCALAGLVLMPGLGLVGTQCAAVVLNLAAAAGALFVARRRPFAGEVEPAAGTEAAHPEPGAAGARGRATLFVFAYALSGGVAMLYEVAWSRSLVLVLGSSTYSYSTMLTTFLVLEDPRGDRRLAARRVLAPAAFRQPRRAARGDRAERRDRLRRHRAGAPVRSRQAAAGGAAPAHRCLPREPRPRRPGLAQRRDVERCFPLRRSLPRPRSRRVP